MYPVTFVVQRVSVDQVSQRKIIAEFWKEEQFKKFEIPWQLKLVIRRVTDAIVAGFPSFRVVRADQPPSLKEFPGVLRSELVVHSWDAARGQ